MSKKSKQKAAKAAAKQEVVTGAVASKTEVFEGDSKILPALQEALKEDKPQAVEQVVIHQEAIEKSAQEAYEKYQKMAAVEAKYDGKENGTPLSKPTTLKQSPLVKTQVEPSVKPKSADAIKVELAKKGLTVAGQGAAQAVVSADNTENQLIKALPDEKPITGSKTPAEKAAEGAAYHTTPLAKKEVAPLKHTLGVITKTFTAARNTLNALWESAKVFGALKPDPADTYKMNFMETKVLQASCNHLEKYIVGMADNVSDATWKHFTAHTKIQHNHILSQIERMKAYIQEHGTLTMEVKK